MIVLFHLALIASIAAALNSIAGVGGSFMVGLSISVMMLLLSHARNGMYSQNFAALYSATPIYFVLALVSVHFMGLYGLLAVPIVMAFIFINAEALFSRKATSAVHGTLLDRLDNPTGFIDARGQNLFDDDTYR